LRLNQIHLRKRASKEVGDTINYYFKYLTKNLFYLRVYHPESPNETSSPNLGEGGPSIYFRVSSFKISPMEDSLAHCGLYSNTPSRNEFSFPVKIHPFCISWFLEVDIFESDKIESRLDLLLSTSLFFLSLCFVVIFKAIWGLGRDG
jgi:hypothetical protein